MRDEEADRGAEADECCTVRRLPTPLLIACIQETDQTSAVRALRAALAS